MSIEYMEEFQELTDYATHLCAKNHGGQAFIQSDGTVWAEFKQNEKIYKYNKELQQQAEQMKNVKKLVSGMNTIYGLCNDGSVISAGRFQLPKYENLCQNIIDISVAWDCEQHIDRVYCRTRDDIIFCSTIDQIETISDSILGCKNIIQMVTTPWFQVFLCADGTAVSYNWSMDTELRKLRGIKKLYATKEDKILFCVMENETVCTIADESIFDQQELYPLEAVQEEKDRMQVSEWKDISYLALASSGAGPVYGFDKRGKLIAWTDLSKYMDDEKKKEQFHKAKTYQRSFFEVYSTSGISWVTGYRNLVLLKEYGYISVATEGFGLSEVGDLCMDEKEFFQEINEWGKKDIVTIIFLDRGYVGITMEGDVFRGGGCYGDAITVCSPGKYGIQKFREAVEANDRKKAIAWLQAVGKYENAPELLQMIRNSSEEVKLIDVMKKIFEELEEKEKIKKQEEERNMEHNRPILEKIKEKNKEIAKCGLLQISKKRQLKADIQELRKYLKG